MLLHNVIKQGRGPECAAMLLRVAKSCNRREVVGRELRDARRVTVVQRRLEVDGVANAWESMVSTWPQELESGDAVILLQASGKRHPDLANVPLVIEYAKTEMANKLVRGVINNFGATARPYVVTPGTPKARVEILRKAFMDTMKDPEFLAEAKKANLDINPETGAELEQNVKNIFKLEPALIAKLREILK